MCKGEADAEPDHIELPNREPTRPKTQTRPTESRREERPATSQKVEQRASSSHHDRRPPTSTQRHRPSSSRHDSRPVTAGPSSRKPSSSHTSSGRPKTSTHQKYNKRELEQLTVPEGGVVQYTGDSKVKRDVASFSGMLGHHTRNFYTEEDFDDEEGELAVGATRRTLLRYYIGTEILDDIVKAVSPKSDADVEELANKLAERYLAYAIPPRNSQREDHILDLCKLGVRIRGLIYNNPSIWKFGEWKRPYFKPGSIMVFPALLQNNEEVAPSEVVRV